MSLIERFVGLTFQIDTNRINSRQRDANMNQLERWADDDVIQIEVSDIVSNECLAGKDSKRQEKSNGYIFSLIPGGMDREVVKKIGRILFPKGVRSQNQRNDVGIVYHARYYNCFLITRDGGSRSQPGGILGHKAALAEIGCTVMNDMEAVDLVHLRIRDRDAMAIKAQKNFGNPLPEWVGRD